MWKSLLKYISFGSLALLAAVLVAGTFLERFLGVSIYSSPWFVAVWGVLLFSSLLYIFKTSVRRVGASLFLHFSFAVVLAGAFVTWLAGERGELFVCKGAPPASMFVRSDGEAVGFPFRLVLLACGAEYEEDTVVPHDYFAELLVQCPGGGEEVARLSMNRVYDRDGYRFYISAVEGDCVTLLVSHDAWGVALTYSGYILVVLGFVLLFVSRNTQRAALKRRLSAMGAWFPGSVSQSLWVKVFWFSSLFCCLIFCAGVHRWMGTGVFPVTNGAEVMMFIAFSAFLSVFVLRKNRAVACAAFGFALLCSVVALSSGVVSAGPVSPVLRISLLPLHVLTIVASYLLIGLLAVTSLVALCLYRFNGNYEHLEVAAMYGRNMLYLAVLLLVAGIFLGAVWANISWGRYWGWDPKEVWALITLIVCSFGFHIRSLPFMARPLVFHFFCIVAFIVMLFTYLGVNYFFGGLHSYA